MPPYQIPFGIRLLVTIYPWTCYGTGYFLARQYPCSSICHCVCVCVCAFFQLPFPGKPVKLSTNCFKLVLAELKHFHMRALEKHKRATENPGTPDPTLPQIPPPNWTPAVLEGVQHAPHSAGMLDDGSQDQDGLDDDDQPHNFQQGSSSSILANINSSVDLASADVGGGRRTASSIGEYIDAIQHWSTEKQIDIQTFDQPRKKARGNHGFFTHLRDQRVLHPRKADETVAAYEARLRAIARESWDQNETW